MDEVQCPQMFTKVGSSNGVSTSVEIANNLLIYRNFEECLSVCQEGLNKLRQAPDCFGQESVNTLRDALCVDAIQAFAELNRWQEVLPFMTQIYQNLEEAPASIVQLCILLHAEVKDYPTSAALANIWLKHPGNAHRDLQERYLETVDIYVGHVLIPANRWDDIEPFLESCPGLSSDRKGSFLKVVRTLRHQLDQVKVEQIEEILEEDTDKGSLTKSTTHVSKHHTHKAHEKQGASTSNEYTSYVARVSGWVSRNIPVVTLYVVRHITVIALILYILITKADVGKQNVSTT